MAMHLLQPSLLPLVLLSPLCIQAQTTVVTITAAPSVPTNPPQYVSDSTFESAILNSTNLYRSQHNATALTYNDTLADFAQNYSSGCRFEHSVGSPVPIFLALPRHRLVVNPADLDNGNSTALTART